MGTTYALRSGVLVAGILFAGLAAAQPGGRAPGPGIVEPAEGERIAWYGTLTEGLAEAKRLERPVLLLSAAPHCGLVPGVW